MRSFDAAASKTAPTSSRSPRRGSWRVCSISICGEAYRPQVTKHLMPIASARNPRAAVNALLAVLPGIQDARERLDLVMTHDMTAWAALCGLMDECPVIHAAMHARGCHTVDASAFEFISSNAQVASVWDFLDALSARLSGDVNAGTPDSNMSTVRPERCGGSSRGTRGAGTAGPRDRRRGTGCRRRAEPDV